MTGSITETLDHDSLSLVFQQGNQACDRSEWAEAVSCYERCVRDASEHCWALNNLGFALTRLNRFSEAEGYLRRALRLEPGNPRFLSNLIMCLDSGGHSLDAIDFRRTLAEGEPEAFDNLFHLAGKLQSVGCNEESLTYFRRAIALRPEHRVCRSNYLLACNYSDRMTPEQVTLEHLRHSEVWNRIGPTVSASVLAESLPEDGFRIGYLSGDFGHHPVGKIMAALLPFHDRSSVQIYGYSDRSNSDAWTNRVSSQMDVFREVSSCSDDQLVELIRNDRLNVLIEMNGHTGGKNRLAVLNRRVAPIQISFLGYPNTSGVSGIDYFLTDEHCDPPEVSDWLHTEQLIRLKNGFLCFDPAIENLPHGPSPCHDSGHITFGTFNNPAKVSPSAIEAWAVILRQVPDSSLLVKYGSRFESEWLRNRWRTEFARHGILPERLKFCGAEQKLAGHYQRMASVDLALDSFPYQGTTTTLETLSSGTPVLTLAGETYCRRASSAILLRHHWADLVTTNVSEYINQAVHLTRDRAHLDRLRKSIQKEFPVGPVRDGKAFVREMEFELTERFRQMRRSAVPETSQGTSRCEPIIVICSGMPRRASKGSGSFIDTLGCCL
ncbi:MAG: tetratricopeptide repeat protein [Planctomycetaceae bacterium]|nr:tetratricopeptide repeat protein [Planctomycetaceae bacterium]